MDTQISCRWTRPQSHQSSHSVCESVSHLQVSKPNFRASSTWSWLAKVSPMSPQASWASVKFRSGCVFLVIRVTPMILHGPETISSAKESQSPSVGCCPCLSPRALLLGRASLSTWQLGLKFRNNRTQIRQLGACLDPCSVSPWVQVHPPSLSSGALFITWRLWLLVPGQGQV